MNKKLIAGAVALVAVVGIVAAAPAIKEMATDIVVTRKFSERLTQEGVSDADLTKWSADGFETDKDKLARIATGGQPLGRWTEGLMFDGIAPMPWLKSAVNWYPKTETVQPDEMRVTFMGTSPLPRPGQMGTSIYVELGNGTNFIFDFGPGAVANYLASGVPLQKINNIFLTHLHWDHFASLPYAYMFGAWGGRWHETLRVTGPSGRKPEFGTRHMVQKMGEMLNWHKESFDTGPIGEGWKVDVNEFDFNDDGGVVYDKDGVRIIHWRQSHTEDGASAYRLDWNGLSFAFTGDGRPNGLTLKYAKGVDLLVTEIQPEVVGIAAQTMGVMPFMARATMDMAHNPAYAAGYLYNETKPRLAMGTHVLHDTWSEAEILAEVRHHWKGPFRMGAPDMVVVNVTKDKIWVRDGVLAEYPNMSPPTFDMAPAHGLVVPAPRRSRADIQDPSIRSAEIPPSAYYPEGYQPKLIEDWPTDKPIYLPEKMVPPGLKAPARKTTAD